MPATPVQGRDYLVAFKVKAMGRHGSSGGREWGSGGEKGEGMPKGSVSQNHGSHHPQDTVQGLESGAFSILQEARPLEFQLASMETRGRKTDLPPFKQRIPASSPVIARRTQRCR